MRIEVSATENGFEIFYSDKTCSMRGKCYRRDLERLANGIFRVLTESKGKVSLNCEEIEEEPDR